MEEIPKFAEYAQTVAGGRAQALAVLAGTTDVAEFAAQLEPVARVVIEPPNGPIQVAFQVTGFPTVYLVDAGGVVAMGGASIGGMAEVPATVVAAA